MSNHRVYPIWRLETGPKQGFGTKVPKPVKPLLQFANVLRWNSFQKAQHGAVHVNSYIKRGVVNVAHSLTCFSNALRLFCANAQGEESKCREHETSNE